MWTISLQKISLLKMISKRDAKQKITCGLRKALEELIALAKIFGRRARVEGSGDSSLGDASESARLRT
jgi:hypothetical protein